MQSTASRVLVGRVVFAIAGALLVSTTCASAQTYRGSYNYASAQQCAAARKIPAEFCANAAANAQAEFDEKAPRFPSREACERVHGARRCNLGFGGGKSSGVFFTPRMQSFAIKVVSERDMTVTPVVGSISVSPRSILRRDTHINPSVATHARQNFTPPQQAYRHGHGGARDATFGLAQPEGPAGPAPPRAPVDPNFNCAAVLEPGTSAGDIGCWPARRSQ